MVVQTRRDDAEIISQKSEPLIVDDVESQKDKTQEKKPKSYGMWVRIYLFLLLANIGTYLGIVPIGFANGGCSPENIQIVVLVLNFISVVFTFATIARGYTIRGAGFVFVILSGIVGITSYILYLPLPDGICNIYIWNLMLIDSAMVIALTIVGVVVDRYCYY